MANSSSPLLQCKNVSLAVSNIPLLQNINLSIAESELLVLLGRNGAGKTTFLRALIGYHPVCAGEILMQSKAVTSLSGLSRAKAFVYIPHSLPFVPAITVSDFLSTFVAAERARTAGSVAALEKVIRETVESTGIQPLLGKFLHILSAGELRRVLLTAAAASSAPIVLLDEPCSNLDPFEQTRALAIIKSIQVSGRSIVFTSHSLNKEARIATRVLGIVDKTIKDLGTQMDINWDFVLKDVYGITEHEQNLL